MRLERASFVVSIPLRKFRKDELDIDELVDLGFPSL